MYFSYLALVAWATMALASPSQSNVCTSGAVGKQLSRRDEPGVQLYCSQKLYPSTWKTESPDWQKTLSKCDLNKIKKDMNAKLGYSADTYCKCIKGKLPACSDPTQIRSRDFKSCVCKPGTIKGSYGGCQKCPADQIPSQDQKSCVCPSGKEKYNGKCVKKCRNDQVRNYDGKCVCPEGKKEAYGVCKATPTCRSDQETNSKGECVCPPGKEEVKAKGACKPVCTQGQTRDNAGDCQISCKGGRVVDGQCQCPVTKKLEAGECKCTGGKVPVGQDGCTCGDGKTFLDGQCVPVVTCTAPKIPDGNNGCKCPSGTSGEQCEIVGCTPPKISDGNKGCKCPDGTTGEQCVPIVTCTAPKIPDGNGGCRCNGGNTGEQCECNTDQSGVIPDGKGGCKCPDGKTIIDGQCVPIVTCTAPKISDGRNGCKCPDERFGEQCRGQQRCNAGQVPDGEGGCKCLANMPFTQNGRCVTSCTAPRQPSQDLTCECPNGEVDGVCQAQCRQDQIPDPDNEGQCKCPQGQIERTPRPGQPICRTVGETCENLPIPAFPFDNDPTIYRTSNIRFFRRKCQKDFCDPVTAFEQLKSGSFQECIDDCARVANFGCSHVRWDRLQLTCDLISAQAVGNSQVCTNNNRDVAADVNFGG